MTHRKMAISVLLLSAIAFVATTITYANIIYPTVGSDFAYFIPHLVDSYLHFHVNGFSIQWYTPTFGGGMPAYPNPQDMQFTLPELFMLVLNPWRATMAASATYVLLGFIAGYYFFDHTLGFSPLTSTLGAIFLNINGFIFTRIIVGHVGTLAFPLQPILLIALLQRRLPVPLRAIAIAAVIAILIHSGGFYMLVIFALSLSIVFPALLLIRPDILSGIKPLPTLLWTVILTILLAGSKLYAVYSFMGHFSRIQQDHYTTDLLGGLSSIALQLINSTAILPAIKLAGPDISINLAKYIGYMQKISGTKYGLWEFDSSLSPGLYLLLITGLFFWITNLKKRGWSITRKQMILIALMIFSVWVTAEFRLANGWIYPQLQKLPILQSLHVNLRFTAAYILPLSLAGAWTFERIQPHLAPYIKMTIFTIIVGLTVLSPLNYFLIGPNAGFSFLYEIQPSLAAYANIKRGETYPIEELQSGTYSDSLKNNVLLDNASLYYSYDPIFGYYLENYHPQTHPGLVTDERNGYLNMTNPAGLVYPKENNLSLFERIKVTDRQNFEIFINHGQPNWVRPQIQYVLDYLMAISFVGILIALAGYLVSYGVSFYRSLRTRR